MKNTKNEPQKPKYSFFKKILYTLGGYPPEPQPLSDEDWAKWKSRFESPEYDWTKHSGNKGGRS